MRTITRAEWERQLAAGKASVGWDGVSRVTTEADGTQEVLIDHDRGTP